MNRAELDLITADVEATEKLVAAKNAYRDKPTPANKAKLDAAKREISDLRNFWRGVRAESNPGATVPAVKASTKAGN
jgi:hypothetical protein